MAQNNYYAGNSDAYTQEYYDQYDSTISSGEARILICFCVDTSASMNIIINDPSEVREIRGTGHSSDGNNVVSVEPRFPWVKLVTRLDELRKVFSTMLQKMKNNDVIANAASVCIVNFDLFADCFLEFTPIGRISPTRPTGLRLGKDRTNAAKGLKMALGRIEQQEQQNYNAGNDSYRPVLVFMSDGRPTDGAEAERMREEIRERSEKGELNVIPVAIGKGLDERWLRGLSRESKVYHMTNDREFEEVFEIITKKIHNAVMVIPTDESEDNLAYQADENTENTLYGEDHSAMDDLNAFMNA